MGSEYKIVEDSLVLHEMSNRFTLMASATSDGSSMIYADITLARQLTPEQLVEIGFKFIQTAAYWEGGRKLRELIDKLRADIYFLDD